MKILWGYMGCGKSSVGEYLNKYYNLSTCDLDDYIEMREHKSIADIFESRGEIYFRNIEHQYLKHILVQNEFDILALGGGTPCYAGNIELISQYYAKSIYLKVNLDSLVERLFINKDKRPLIKDIETHDLLKDFIRKHLFEREFYYRQADQTLNVSDMSVKEIAKAVMQV